MKIVLNGACGKMGRIVREICAQKQISVIGVDIKKDGEVLNSFDEIKDDFDGIIDFSSPSGVALSLNFAVKRNKPIVIGTTGYGEKEKELILISSKKIPVFVSPNMSKGINLCFYIVDILSKVVKSDVHIHEVHHKTKKDAPSGTAVFLKGIVEKNGLDAGVSYARISDIVGEHSITFGFEGEKIVLSHIAYTREIFAKGAIDALKWLLSKKAGLYNFNDIFQMQLNQSS